MAESLGRFSRSFWKIFSASTGEPLLSRLDPSRKSASELSGNLSAATRALRLRMERARRSSSSSGSRGANDGYGKFFA